MNVIKLCKYILLVKFAIVIYTHDNTYLKHKLFPENLQFLLGENITFPHTFLWTVCKLVNKNTFFIEFLWATDSETICTKTCKLWICTIWNSSEYARAIYIVFVNNIPGIITNLSVTCIKHSEVSSSTG